MEILQSPPTIPITLPDSLVLAGEEKKKSMLSHVGREKSYEKIGLTTVAVSQDLLSGMLLVC